MKLLCLFSFLFSFNAFLNAESFAFYYGKDFKDKSFYFFDNVVVQVDNIDKKTLEENKERLFGYVSICETDDESLDNSIIIGENKNWQSKIIDLRKEKAKDYVIRKIDYAKSKGFKNFFFDTLDSYLLVLKKENEIKDYQKSIIEVIKRVKEKYSDLKIIINRGFEIMEDLKKYSDYIAAESLYFGIDNDKNYIQMKEEDTNWLKDKLNFAKSIGYKVIVIDYLPVDDKRKIEVARKIKEDGFIPYISDYTLENWGSNEFEKIKRDILVFYDSDKVPDVIYSQAHRFIQLPLEYYGYRADIRDINKLLPKDTSRYAGVIFALENNSLKNPELVFKWVLNQIKNDKKILFLGYIPFTDEKYLNKLGLYLKRNDISEKWKVVDTGYKSFEVPFNYYSDNILDGKNLKPVIAFKNSKNERNILAGFTDWGGFAVESGLIINVNDYELYPLNPFEFIKEGLKLRDIPVLDPTTENGRRILIAHIDGDGFVSKYESDPRFYSSEIIRDRIIKKYKIPHSVSVITGDIDRADIKSDLKEKFIDIAKSIFLLDNVEVANHSYSHPFRWIDLKLDDEFQHIEQVYNISIPGYKFDINYELLGSKKFIEENLSPVKKNNIFFWTGDCIAPFQALKILYDNDILNINGGYTVITKDKPYLSLIAPYGIKRENYYQIFSGQQNENVYTNLWTGPFWGYKKVLETFELTENPRRLKPVDIYYHFYSGSKYESLKALEYVYDNVLKQKLNPQFASDYVRKVIDFYNYEIYNYNDKWIIVSNSNSKTVRVNKNYFPSILNDSSAGYNTKGDYNYINLKGNSPYVLVLSTQSINTPYLKSSNSKLEEFRFIDGELYIKLKGYLDIDYELENASNCKISEKNTKDNIFYIKEIYGKCR